MKMKVIREYNYGFKRIIKFNMIILIKWRLNYNLINLDYFDFPMHFLAVS